MKILKRTWWLLLSALAFLFLAPLVAAAITNSEVIAILSHATSSSQKESHGK